MEASPTLRQVQEDSHARDPVFEQVLPAGFCLGDDGRYRIHSVIAIGGMATVYKALDRRLHIVCAIKALFLPSTVDSADLESFRQEAHLLASIHFPGIIAVRDMFIERDYAFLVMDFVDGENLYDRHRRTGRLNEETQDLPISPVPEDQVVLYGLALSGALDYLHRRSPVILYRDMKPHNIMRRAGDGRTVLLDFGIARRLRSRAKSFPSDDFGTPGYAAPEQYEINGAIDARTDIYGLGAVLTELATGYNPRAEDAPRSIPPVASLSSTLSPMMIEILQRCVEANPRDRFQSALELQNALEGWQRSPRAVRRKSVPEKIWSFAMKARACGALAAANGLVCATDQSGALFVVDAASGALRTERARPGDEVERQARYSVSSPKPGIAGELALFAQAVVHPGGGTVTLFDDALLPRTRIAVPHAKFLSLWTGWGASFVVAHTKPAEMVLWALSKDGSWRNLWRVGLPAPPVALASIEGGLVVLDERGGLARIDNEGSLLWRQPIFGHSGPRPLLQAAEERLIVGGGADDLSLTAVELAGGRIHWRTAGVGVPLSPLLPGANGRQVLVPTRDAGLVVVDSESGRVLHRPIDFPRTIIGACTVPSMTNVIVLAEYGYGARVLLYDVEARRVLWSEGLAGMGAAGSPVVCGDVIVAQDLAGRLHGWRWESCQ